MDKCNESFFTVQKNLLKFCGLYPSRNVYYKLYSFLVVSLLWSYTIGLIPPVIQNQTYDALLENVPSIISDTTVSVFYALLHVNKKRIYNLMDKLETGVFLPNMARGGTFEKDLLMKCVKFCKIAGICSVILASFPTPFTLLAVIENEEEILPFGSFPVYGIFLNYKMKVIIQSVVNVIVPTGYSTVIFLYVTILFHILTHFKILQNALKHMEETCGNLEPEAKWDSQLHWLREVIYYHNSIIEVAAEIENLFNVSILLTFIGSPVFIIFAASYGSLDAFFTFGYIRDTILMVASVLHIGILSYIGNEVTLESEKILRGMVSYIIVLRSFRNSGVHDDN